MKNLKSQLNKNIKTALKELSYPLINFSLINSKNPDFGDLSCNVALILTKKLKISPIEISKIL